MPKALKPNGSSSADSVSFSMSSSSDPEMPKATKNATTLA
jgi:hypothetical protein